MYYYCYVYVFSLLRMFCSVYSVFIVLLCVLAVCKYVFNYALQPFFLRLIVRSGSDVSTFATRRLHACHHARAPSGGTVGEKCPRILPKCRFTRYIYGSFTCRKARTWDSRLYFPSVGRRARNFFALKIREPANSATKGQHATSRPPKPLCKYVLYYCHRVPTQLQLTNVSCHIYQMFKKTLTSRHEIPRKYAAENTAT
jgi:hypothetical protein